MTNKRYLHAATIFHCTSELQYFFFQDTNIDSTSYHNIVIFAFIPLQQLFFACQLYVLLLSNCTS